jgi:hypothetical protein
MWWKKSQIQKLTSDADFTSRPKPASDLAFWIEVNADLRSYFADITLSQNIEDSDFSTSGRKFGGKKRYVNKGLFCRHLENGETVQRDCSFTHLQLVKCIAMCANYLAAANVVINFNQALMIGRVQTPGLLLMNSQRITPKHCP